jgi:hypothetical protein
MYGFDAANRTYGHEYRGFDLSVVGGDDAGACIRAGVFGAEFKLHKWLLGL